MLQYRLQSLDATTECRQLIGTTLLDLLRHVLFRHGQELLDSLLLIVLHRSEFRYGILHSVRCRQRLDLERQQLELLRLCGVASSITCTIPSSGRLIDRVLLREALGLLLDDGANESALVRHANLRRTTDHHAFGPVGVVDQRRHAQPSGNGAGKVHVVLESSLERATKQRLIMKDLRSSRGWSGAYSQQSQHHAPPHTPVVWKICCDTVKSRYVKSLPSCRYE